MRAVWWWFQYGPESMMRFRGIWGCYCLLCMSWSAEEKEDEGEVFRSTNWTAELSPDEDVGWHQRRLLGLFGRFQPRGAARFVGLREWESEGRRGTNIITKWNEVLVFFVRFEVAAAAATSGGRPRNELDHDRVGITAAVSWGDLLIAGWARVFFSERGPPTHQKYSWRERERVPCLVFAMNNIQTMHHL